MASVGDGLSAYQKYDRSMTTFSDHSGFHGDRSYTM